MNKKELIILICIVILAGYSFNALGVPTGPVITYRGYSNSTRELPTREDNALLVGGRIATILLEHREQNEHWKAYVGNVSGTYVLEDANNYSIYEWAMTSVAGEVYATRQSTIISWGTVECAVASNVTNEEIQMHHNSTNTNGDNITSTFDDEATDHSEFVVGGVTITANSCGYSINPYINDSAQSADLFEIVLLQDASDNIIYVTEIEDDKSDYRNASADYTSDFQLIVAENASPGGPYQTDYFFYVELD